MLDFAFTTFDNRTKIVLLGISISICLDVTFVVFFVFMRFLEPKTFSNSPFWSQHLQVVARLRQVLTATKGRHNQMPLEAKTPLCLEGEEVINRATVLVGFAA